MRSRLPHRPAQENGTAEAAAGVRQGLDLRARRRWRLLRCPVQERRHRWGDPALVEDLTYTQVAWEVAALSCSGAAMLPGGHPALVEDLTYTQVAAGGYHAVLLRSGGNAGGDPALIGDLTYAPIRRSR